MDIFDTNVLIRVVPNLKTASQFLLDTFFPNIVTSDTEFVTIDVDVGKRRLAPFCSPLVEGKIVEGRRVTSNTFSPPYIKDKRAPDLRRPVRRALGERIGGEMSAAERMEANLNFEMADQVDMIQRRLEWMAAQALLAGSITVKGDGFPDTVIDFRRDAALTVVLAGGNRWGQANISPANDLDGYAVTILKKSGAAPTDIVFTPTPWKHFRNDQSVKDSIWFPRSGDSEIDFGGGVKKGVIFKGVWGTYRLWLHNDWYVDPADETEKRILPDGTVVMSSAELMGTRAFGAIMDPDFNYGAMPYAPKSWTTKDPAQRWVMMQSAPLVIPSRVNAALASTVCDAVL